MFEKGANGIGCFCWIWMIGSIVLTLLSCSSWLSPRLILCELMNWASSVRLGYMCSLPLVLGSHIYNLRLDLNSDQKLNSRCVHSHSCPCITRTLALIHILCSNSSLSICELPLSLFCGNGSYHCMFRPYIVSEWRKHCLFVYLLSPFPFVPVLEVAWIKKYDTEHWFPFLIFRVFHFLVPTLLWFEAWLKWIWIQIFNNIPRSILLCVAPEIV